MRLLVLSDSHRDLSTLVPALRAFAPGADALIHLGDGVEDLRRAALFAKLKLPRVEAVRGNGDGDRSLPLRKLLQLGGRKVFLSHGHVEGAGEGCAGIVAAASAGDAGLALFGHTHRPFFEESRGMLILNPGSISRPRGKLGPTFAVIDIPEDPESWFEFSFYEAKPGNFGPTIREIDIA
jgi:putative phosphoesterase